MNIPEINLPLTSASHFNPIIADRLRTSGLNLKISTVNWPEFPLRPDVEVWLAHNGTHLMCLFNVSEPHLKVATLNDNGPVWEDSCVELFVADPDGTHYYNFEVNAAGTALAALRESRESFKHFDADLMAKIIRCSTVSREVHDEKSASGIVWSLFLAVPFNLIGYSGNIPKTVKLNLYKCGDKTATPHFLSWNPINTPSPDFHRPEYFKELKLSHN